MNAQQELWWKQAQSDFALWNRLKRQAEPACHQLQFLQMATEKLGKAYFWRTGQPDKKSHACFVRFLKRLADCRRSDRQKITKVFAFRRFRDFDNWLKSVLPIARELERLSPNLAGDNGPNPEYPWPHENPEFAPVEYEFPIHSTRTESARGRQLVKSIQNAIDHFPVIA